MYAGSRIGVVVPAWNESRLIASTLSTMPDFVDRIVVVDDASTDDTAERARAVGDPRVTVITHEVNGGVGSAILTGHSILFAEGCDVSVVMAGDAQMDPAYLSTLLDPIVNDGIGFAKANRFFNASSYAGMSRTRIFGNVVLSFLTKASSGYWHLFDPQNGYTALSASAWRLLDVASIARGYEFENSVLINLNIANVRARDVPIPAIYGDEVSGIRLPRIVPRLLRTLWRGFWFRIVRKYVVPSFSPVALLLFTGLALAGFGFVIGVFALAYSIGPREASTGTWLLSVAPGLTGVFMLIQALVLDIEESPR
ncbi:MAG: glycosyltransferase [Actinobacteria bacterium]|uniref:Unannotated protein n=1 Tax=freshwater metagenome TaxID=449393 RepID=A0A6J7S079_9ZZZZ|nr:glycosyltransferase [Actinomycetota bacterium]MSW37472.1 glycosyltransferase [Actinomycetota bacterium]MSX37873.1 glycosyltransferase [Actinomycetota bacterium]